MSRASGVLAAMKAVPGGARYTPGPQSGAWGALSPVAANAQWGNPHAAGNGYGPFLPRPSRLFTDGAFGPMSPIQPVPVDVPPPGGEFPDPRWWQAPVGWNLPTQPRTEGLSLASFDQLRILSQRYSVARACIELRKEEIRGLEWSIELTTQAAKAYQGDRHAMRDFGERAAEATKFFKRPDPDFWTFGAWLDAMLEEIFVYDALSLVFRPKYGKGLGLGLLGSDLDSIRLVAGPTIRPLVDMHGGHPRPPAPAYQQYLFGVPRSDYMTIASGADIDDYGLTGAQVNEFRSDVMFYAPLIARRETPYGFPPIERALLPIVSGLQKQEFQLDYFTEGTVPAVYISPGDSNMTPTQVMELQNALNGIAGDAAYHLKVIVLPPGSKVEPQRPVDLSDGFDLLVQTQVAMAFDVMPTEIGILPNVGGQGAGGSSNASAIRFGAAEARDLKTRKSTKPLLMYLCDIFNYVLQDLCGQADMQFAFEGLVDDEDKQQITQLGVSQVQNGIASIDEVRERLDLAPWGLQETSEPVVFTAQGPIPFSMAPQLIANMQAGGGGGQGTNSGQRTTSSRSRTNQPSVRRGGQTKPNGSHPAPVAPHREAVTPAHAAAAGAIQSPGPRTGGTTSRSSVAGSRKKAVEAELSALARHLRKGREITSWEARHIPDRALGMIAEDLAKGVLIDVAVERAGSIVFASDAGDAPSGVGRSLDKGNPGDFAAGNDSAWGLPGGVGLDDGVLDGHPVAKAVTHWPGWERDLGLVGAYKHLISDAFHDAESRGSALRKKAATGGMFVSSTTLRDLISDEVRAVFSGVLTPLWTEAWHLGYAAAKSLATGDPADFTVKQDSEALTGFIGTEGEHWLAQVSRTGLENAAARAELIARTEVARAVNSAAIQCYRDHGVTHKHLLASPGACEICDDVADDGDIPLDAVFSAGGTIGVVHPACRCVPAPAGVEAEPPLADLGKNRLAEVAHAAAQAGRIAAATQDHPYKRDTQSGAGNCICGHAEGQHEDPDRVAWLLIRARDEDGKWRYLLQQRDDGSWGMPGGTCHVGEDGWDAAVRETSEEVGDLPSLTFRANLSHVDPDGVQVYLYLCEADKVFTPPMNGSTPEETAGTGWFRRKEVGKLDLTSKFEDDWDHIIADTLAGVVPMVASKALQRVVNETGEVQVLTEPSQRLQATGARWPYPRRSDGTEWPDAGPGAVQDDHGSAGAEPPNHINDMAAPEPHGSVEPRGSDDGKMPSRGRKPAPPPAEFPDQGEQGQDAWPYPQNTLQPPMTSVGAPKADKPVTGSVPAETPQGYRPHSYEPQAFDPGLCVVCSTPQGNVIHTLPKGAGGPADHTDPNPVDAHHIYLLMSSNFPPASIEWVKRARWVGPVNIPWDRIDTHDIKSWAAYTQPARVKEFERLIRAHKGNVKPSILIQDNDSTKAIIIDGHHRGLAHHNMGQPVLSYLGIIDPKDRQAAEETHSHQLHSGADPRNKAVE